MSKATEQFAEKRHDEAVELLDKRLREIDRKREKVLADLAPLTAERERIRGAIARLQTEPSRRTRNHGFLTHRALQILRENGGSLSQPEMHKALGVRNTGMTSGLGKRLHERGLIRVEKDPTFVPVNNGWGKKRNLWILSD